MAAYWNGPYVEAGLRFFHSHEQPLPEFPALTHANEAICTPAHVLAPHRHPAWEICYFVAGQATWDVNGAKFPIRAGDVFISRPDELHSGRPDPQDPNHNCAIGFDPAALPLPTAALAAAPDELGHAVAEARAVDDAFDLFGARVIHTGPGPEAIFRRIIGELDEVHHGADARRRALAVAMVQALLVELFVLVTRAGLGTGQAAHAVPRRTDLRELLAWIGTRLAAPPSLDEMAARIGLSPAHLAVVFRRELGRTPLEQVTEMRISEACARLDDQRANVTAVAHGLGFCSSQYFSAVFRKHRGCTPSAWRRRR